MSIGGVAGYGRYLRRPKPSYPLPPPVPDRPPWPESGPPVSGHLRAGELRAALDRLPPEARERLGAVTRGPWVSERDFEALRAWAFVVDSRQRPAVLLAFANRMTVASPSSSGATNSIHLLPGQFPELVVYRGTSGAIDALELIEPMEVLGPPEIAEEFVAITSTNPWLQVTVRSPAASTGPWWAK